MLDEGAQLSPKQTLDARGLRPRKRLGQNFLVDPRFARRVAEAIPSGAFVIEIGAGTGSLTGALSANARRVIALEIDRDLVSVLSERFSDCRVVEVHAGDALDYDLRAELDVQPAPRAVVGNLPYYITTPLVERVVEAAASWESAVLMVQREYARRLAAKPGTSDYGSLTVYVGYYCTVERLFDVGAAGFYPAPAVASSVVRLTPRPARGEGVRNERLLLKTIRAAFAQRRKTLSNCLVARASLSAAIEGAGKMNASGNAPDRGETRAAIEAAIRAAGIETGIRGERLSLDEFRRLSNALDQAGIDILDTERAAL